MAWEIQEGHILDRLRDMPEGSVQTVITSPPYWGLRDYGVDGQLGLEETPAKFITAMVEVFTEVHRVLRDDGTLWLNIGDSYARGAGHRKGNFGREPQAHGFRDTRKTPAGLKDKDLVGIPWMLAFALRAEGWYLRRDIIWSKPNPMPESVTDRPTTAHEYIFLLTKKSRYFYDQEAINEPAEYSGPNGAQHSPYGQGFTRRSEAIGHHKARPGIDTRGGNQGTDEGIPFNPLSRNKRSVWTIATRPFPDAHFATFPPELVAPCVLAGTPIQSCSECGAPWHRIVDRVPTGKTQKAADGWDTSKRAHGSRHQDGRSKGDPGIPVLASITTGWEPTCECGDNLTAPAVVLDPFAGAGTTLLVAEQLGRDSIGIELNPEYADMAKSRIERALLDPARRLNRGVVPIGENQLNLLGDAV